jgi:diguanylate cyclase (GGDEF)-like protein
MPPQTPHPDARPDPIPSGTVREALGDGESVFAPEAGATVQWRVAGALGVAAGLVVLAVLGLGVDASVNVPIVAGLACASLLIGLLCLIFARRLPASWITPELIVAMGFVSAGVLVSGEADSPFALIYIWIAVVSWYFQPLRVAIGLTVLTVVVSAVTMAVAANPEDNAASWWLFVMATLGAVSGLAAVLRRRADQLVAALTDAASRDPLTGLLNRAAFEERADAELARARRHGLRFAVVLGDLDRFKCLNDNFGHRRGDEALRRFSALCSAATRAEDIVARVGGEEFALVLPGTDEAGALALGERLRKALHVGVTAPDGTPITASFGVSSYPEHGDDIKTLLHNADRAMYTAKSLGRDRTVAFTEPADPARR